MSSNTSRVLLSCTAVGVVLCLCLSLILIAGAAVVSFSPQISDVIETYGADATPEVPALPEPDEGLPSEVAAEMAQIEHEMAGLRDLQPDGEISRQLLTPDELRQNVIDDFFSEYTQEEAQEEAVELAAFGFVEPGFDLYNLYLELYSEQVAGYYDDEVEAMFIVQGSGFEGPERITYAHEYTHALQDDNFDFEDKLNLSEEACEGNSERCYALQALIEGDATLAELQWLSVHGTPEDIGEIQNFYNSLEMPVYDSAPPALKQSFIFPYEAGQVFVQSLYDQDGWDSVSEAYQNPPVSSEQILHPERYPADTPVQVTLPDNLAARLGSGWQEIDQDVMGEFGLQMVLAQGIGEHFRLEAKQAEEAAEGWGGDLYSVLYHPETQATVMAIRIAWDTEADAIQFADTFRSYANLRFDASTSGEGRVWNSDQGFVLFDASGLETVWIMAPDGEIAELILTAIQALSN